MLKYKGGFARNWIDNQTLFYELLNLAPNPTTKEDSGLPELSGCLAGMVFEFIGMPDFPKTKSGWEKLTKLMETESTGMSCCQIM